MPLAFSVWWSRWWRALASEVLSTLLLVLLGTAALAGGGELTHVALAFGGLVGGLCAAFGEASGAHMNPAVSLAAALAGALPPGAAAAYAAAQCAGAALAAAALLALLPAPAVAGTVTRVAPGLGAPAAAAVEALLTAPLALAACALWAGPPDPAAPLKLGGLVAALVFAGGKLTGASINPARSFGPALVLNDWENQWVYWAGPLAGAALGALLHRMVLRAPPAPAPRAEELPLRDKQEV